MDDIYANPVGLIKKDIYIIKNKINNKVYIGQSLNVAQRFISHCKKNHDNSLIDMAIQKYGKENFWYEILESQITNYNERERYWINRFNSKTPNGYNILEGGQDPPRYIGENHPSAKLTDEEILGIKKDLRNTNLPLSKIAEKYNISKKQILRINHGISRITLNEDYPIRKNPNQNGKLTEEDIDCIINLLKYTYLFDGEIARQFGVKPISISRINDGTSHKRYDIDYPIRKWKSSGVVLFTYNQVTEIINRLLNTKDSISQIARDYNVSWNSIKLINTGTSKKYRRDTLQYPLRPY
jgi:group I intron endonuclease